MVAASRSPTSPSIAPTAEGRASGSSGTGYRSSSPRIGWCRAGICHSDPVAQQRALSAVLPALPDRCASGDLRGADAIDLGTISKTSTEAGMTWLSAPAVRPALRTRVDPAVADADLNRRRGIGRYSTAMPSAASRLARFSKDRPNIGLSDPATIIGLGVRRTRGAGLTTGTHHTPRSRGFSDRG